MPDKLKQFKKELEAEIRFLLGFKKTTKDEFFSGPRKLLQDGSIEISGIRWGLVAMILVPGYFLVVTAFMMFPFFGVMNGEMEDFTWVPFGWRFFAFLFSLLCLMTAILLVSPPKRKIVLDAHLGSLLIHHSGLLQKKIEIVINIDEIEDVQAVLPDKPGPFRRSKIFLKTKTESVYLMSLGRYYVNAGLAEEIRRIVEKLNQKNADPSG